ncbi:MAG: Cell division protein FtsA [Pelotomaculum sp. PtaB.Bin104]|nr:MAG: Cell division protein FtsA [Pelotomaculum sp. PtaB.Bin104]
MSKRRPAILAGLDIGTSKTAAVIAQVKNGSPQAVGVGISPTVGLQKGLVIDTASVAASIRQALEKAEKMAGAKATVAYIAYHSINVLVKDCHLMNAGQRDHPARPDAMEVPASERLLMIMPPKNRVTLSLPGAEAAARAVTAPSHHIKNIIESARLAGIAVHDVIYSPQAAVKALLSPFEREFGMLLVDIGDATVTVSIHDRGLLQETAVIAIGGEHLVSDLAICLHISMIQAGEVLRQYQRPGGNGYAEHELSRTEGSSGEVTGAFVKSIIEARITEIFHMVDGVVKSFNYPGQLLGGAVLYGGVAKVDGLTAIAENILQLKVRIGAPQAGEQVLGPDLANAYGLVIYGSKQSIGPGGTSNRYDEVNVNGKMLRKVYHWLQGKF